MNIAKDAGLPRNRVQSCGHLKRVGRPLLRQVQRALNQAAGSANQSWQHVLRSPQCKGGERKRLTICSQTFATRPD